MGANYAAHRVPDERGASATRGAHRGADDGKAGRPRCWSPATNDAIGLGGRFPAFAVRYGVADGDPDHGRWSSLVTIW